MQRVVNYSAGEKLEIPVPLASITVSHNPRTSRRGLLEKFHEQGAASQSSESRAEFVKYIQDSHPDIVELHGSIKTHGLIQAPVLRSFRAKPAGADEYVERYGVAVGEGRVLAYAYEEALTGEPQTVRCRVEKLTVDEAFERGIAENIDRHDMNPVDLAEAIHEMLTLRKNPATGKPYTLKELAERFKKSYWWVRDREAIFYLNDSQKNQCLAYWKAGRRNVTRFCTLGKEQKAKQTGEPVDSNDSSDYTTPSENLPSTAQPITEQGGQEKTEIQVEPERRRRVITLKEVVALFDATPLENVERLRALSEVMGISQDAEESLRIALSEREKRSQEQEVRQQRKKAAG